LAELLSRELSSSRSKAGAILDLLAILRDGNRDPRLGAIVSHLQGLRDSLDDLRDLVLRDHVSALRQEVRRLAAGSVDSRLGAVLAALADRRAATLTSFCEAILDELLAATGGRRGVVVFYHAGSNLLEAAAQRGFDDLKKGLWELKLSRTVLEEALERPQGVLYDDAASEPRLLSARSLGLRSILAAPLVQGEQVVGAIYLDDYETAGTFSRSDLELARGVGGLTVFVLHHSRLLPARSVPRAMTRLDAHGAFDRVITRDPGLVAVLEVAARAARTMAPVLIEGETGTGKELVAEGVHLASPRHGGPFVPVNCGAIPAGLAESQLFGHERGSFTGAIQRHRGYVEQAEGGTLFLDEIGEMPLELQTRLLRLLRERKYQRLGGTKTLSSDVRIVAATNRRLDEEVRAERFREDLYYRLDVVKIRVPSLRDRKGDIAPLATHFLAVFAHRAGREMELDPAVLEVLEGYDFPGNVAELENLIERAVALAEDRVIRVGDLPQPVLERLDLGPDGLLRVLARNPRDPGDLDRQKDEVARALARRERDLILRLREEIGMAGAARRFGIARQSLYRRLDEIERKLGERESGPRRDEPFAAARARKG
jgi:transcriptional regulator with GAF, ATPase, and Fis domain